MESKFYTDIEYTVWWKRLMRWKKTKQTKTEDNQGKAPRTGKMKGYSVQQACQGDISVTWNTWRKWECEPCCSLGEKSVEQRQLKMTFWCVWGGLEVDEVQRVEWTGKRGQTDGDSQQVGGADAVGKWGSVDSLKASGFYPNGVRSLKVDHRRPPHLPYTMSNVSVITLLTLNCGKQPIGMRMTRGDCTTGRYLKRNHSGQHLRKLARNKDHF